MKKLSKKLIPVFVVAAMLVTMLPSFTAPEEAVAAIDFSSAAYLTDQASFNSIGTKTGDVTWSTSENAAYFNGGYITINENPLNKVTNSTGFTISFDAKVSDMNAQTGSIFQLYDSSNARKYFAVNGGSSSHWRRMAIYNNDGSHDDSANGVTGYWTADFDNTNYCESGGVDFSNESKTPDSNTWYSITIMMDADGYLYYYVDGVQMAKFKTTYAGTDGASINPSAVKGAFASFNALTLGHSTTPSKDNDYWKGYFKGYIRNVRFTSQAVTASLNGGASIDQSIAFAEAKFFSLAWKNDSENAYLNAYKKYIDACEALDAYKYGGSSTNLATANSNLIAAVNQMNAFTKPDATARTEYRDNSGLHWIETDSVNLLSSTRANGNKYSGDSVAYSKTVDYMRIQVYYAENVLLYDGLVQPKFPVVFSENIQDYTPDGPTINMYAHTVYPANSTEASTTNNSDDFYLYHPNRENKGHEYCWIGKDTGDDTDNSGIDYEYCYYQKSTVISGTAAWTCPTSSDKHYTDKHTSRGVHTGESCASKNYDERTTKRKCHANIMNYNTNKDPDAAMKDIQIIWAHRTSSTEQPSNIANDTFGAGAADVHTYIYNYKGINKNIVSKSYPINNYKEGGLSTFFGNCDNITRYWGTIQTELKNKNTSANTAYTAVKNATGVTADTRTAAYQNLRDALDNSTYKNFYDTATPASTGYTTTSINNFKTAYNNIKSMFAGLSAIDDASGYASKTVDQLTALKTALENAYNNLKNQANFSALDTAYTNAKTAQGSVDASLYTTSSKSTYDTFLNTAANFPYHSKTQAERYDVSEDYQSAITAEAGTLTNAQSKLELLADFDDLDAAKQYWVDYLIDNSSKYTTDSKTALTTYINSTTEFPIENDAAVRADTGVSKQSTKVDVEQAKYEGIVTDNKAAHPETYLDPVADLVYLQNEYDKANTFLKSLNGKTAEYTKASINDLIDAIKTDTVAGGTGNTAETIATASAATKANYGQAVQTDAGTLADGIKNAMAGLEKVEEIIGESRDASAFNAAVEALNNIDPDAYTISDADIASIRNSANVGIKDSTPISYNGATISVLNGSVTQEAINAATDVIVTGLNVRTKSYPITKSDEGDTSFTISARTGTYDSGSATYGTTLVCDSGDPETAWYLEIQTDSMHKKMAYKYYGQRFTTKVLGNTTIKAVKKTSGQKRVKIIRQYGNTATTDKSPIQVVDYVNSGSNYTLPDAPAIAYYTFDKYYIGETGYAEKASVPISDDTEIIARYTENAGAEYAITATELTGGTGYSGSAAYNTKIELKGGTNAYAWIEESDSTGMHYRPFYIGSDVTFFATESTNLKAVTKDEFDNVYKFNLPAVNLRKSGVTLVNGKTTFNAQIVPNGVNVQEYGILIAAPTGSSPAASIDETKVILENSGSHPSEGYSILRAKSTNLVGAKQFTIGVNSLPNGYVYRGYMIYSDSDGTLHNVYSQAMR